MKVWLFDYDLTLYGAEERHVLDSLDHRISLFVQKTVCGDFESAHKIRTDYLEQFGTTLAGLMAMNGTDPDEFFDFIHEPEYLIYPKNAPEKLALLKSLDGPRFVFTNGRHDWSEAGMAHMGIDSAIDGVFDLKMMDWEGKPHESAYEKMERWLMRVAGEGLGDARRPEGNCAPGRFPAQFGACSRPRLDHGAREPERRGPRLGGP